LVGKPEGKRPLGRPSRRCEGYIKMDLGETECEGVEWIHLAQDRVPLLDFVSMVMNFRVPWRWRISRQAEQLWTFQGLCIMELLTFLAKLYTCSHTHCCFLLTVRVV